MTQAFYDRAMTEPDAPAMLPLDESPWLPLYQEAARWVPANHDVTDLGCGTGRFLKQLARNGHYGRLRGVDFSKAALDETASYIPGVELEQIDLREWWPDAERAGGTTYVCLETLEHIDDLQLVERLPPGHQFVFSVPNYESEAHMRWFTSAGQVWERFSGLLTFCRWSLVRLDDRKAIHVVDSRRRIDSW